jgi:hypothetical protein
VSLSWRRLTALAGGWLPTVATTAAAAAAELRRPRGRLRIGLAPDRIVLAGYGGGLKPRLERAEATTVEPRPGAPRWQAAVEALPAVLESAGPCRATVILSNQFVRYAVLPANPALSREDEWLAYAQHRLQAIHGNAIEGWDLRVCETAPRGARVAAAVDRALLDALDAAVTGAGGTLESVQPYLMSAFNRARPAGDGWLVIEEAGRLTLGLIQDGAWRSIRARRVDGPWRHELAGILEQESAALGLEQPCTEVYLHAETAFDAAVHADLRVHDVALPAGANADERALAMVLA